MQPRESSGLRSVSEGVGCSVVLDEELFLPGLVEPL